MAGKRNESRIICTPEPGDDENKVRLGGVNAKEGTEPIAVDKSGLGTEQQQQQKQQREGITACFLVVNTYSCPKVSQSHSVNIGGKNYQHSG